MLERDIETPVCDYAESKGLTAEKFTSPNRRAVPDRMLTGPGGLIFFIEFKATGKAKTVHADATGHELRQWRDHQKRRKNGFRVYVVDDIEEGKRIVQSETAHLAFSIPEQGNRVFPPPRSGDVMA